MLIFIIITKKEKSSKIILSQRDLFYEASLLGADDYHEAFFQKMIIEDARLAWKESLIKSERRRKVKDLVSRVILLF